MCNPFDEILSELKKANDRIEAIQLQINSITNPPQDEILNVSEAANFLNLAKDTVYGFVQERKIPFMKKEKKLYFSKMELIDWLKSGRRQTVEEIKETAKEYIEFRDSPKRPDTSEGSFFRRS